MVHAYESELKASERVWLIQAFEHAVLGGPKT
jgi:hypothetical protein